jgi:hypothetical protein
MTKDQIIEKISKNHIGNERVAFARRQAALERFVTDYINPVEEEILLAREKLIPLYDKLEVLKKEAYDHCTHPPEMLSIGEPADDGSVEVVCKFCGHKAIVVDNDDNAV